MAKHIFVVEATISMGIEVEARTLKAAVKKAREAGNLHLCKCCGKQRVGVWQPATDPDGVELDVNVNESPLVDYHGPNRVRCSNFEAAEAEWDAAAPVKEEG